MRLKTLQRRSETSDLSKQSETEAIHFGCFPNKIHVFSGSSKHYQQTIKSVRQLSLPSAVKSKVHCEKIILCNLTEGMPEISHYRPVLPGEHIYLISIIGKENWTV